MTPAVLDRAGVHLRGVDAYMLCEALAPTAGRGLPLRERLGRAGVGMSVAQVFMLTEALAAFD